MQGLWGSLLLALLLLIVVLLVYLVARKPVERAPRDAMAARAKASARNPVTAIPTDVGKAMIDDSSEG